VTNQRTPFNIDIFSKTHIKNTKALSPNIPYNINIGMKTWINTQPTTSQGHRDLGTHVHAKQDMTYEFDK
jgi:hypothetical protein